MHSSLFAAESSSMIKASLLLMAFKVTSAVAILSLLPAPAVSISVAMYTSSLLD